MCIYMYIYICIYVMDIYIYVYIHRPCQYLSMTYVNIYNVNKLHVQYVYVSI